MDIKPAAQHREHATTASSSTSDDITHEPKYYHEGHATSAVPHAEHGPVIDHKIPQDHVVQAQPDLAWSRIRHTLREPFSEFFGTFILIMFGDGVVAQVVLSGGTKGNYQSINWGWGLGVMLGVYTGGISGAHLNPAVTVSGPPFHTSQGRRANPVASLQTVCFVNFPGANFQSTCWRRCSAPCALRQSSTQITNLPSTSSRVAPTSGL